MKRFYYQLKCKEQDIDGRVADYWSHAFFKGIVEAEDSKSARAYIKSQILNNEMRKDNNLLLSIIEIKKGTEYLEDFFKPRVCAVCGSTFSMANNEYYGLYCCEACHEQAKYLQRKEDQAVFFSSDWSEAFPVIYRIYDKKNDKNYIGQTIRAFTLRWWEHYKNWIQRVPNTSITDFEFTVLEILPKTVTKEELSQREQYYIDKYNALTEGYNSRNEVAQMIGEMLRNDAQQKILDGESRAITANC